MPRTFRPRPRAWLELVVLSALIGAAGLAALGTDSSWGVIVSLGGAALVLLLGGLNLARTWVRVDDQGLAYPSGGHIRTVPWAEVLDAELVQHAQGKQRYWLLLLGLAQVVHWVPLQGLDRDAIWQSVQERVPPAALDPDAHKLLPDYQEWLAHRAQLALPAAAPRRVIGLGPNVRAALGRPWYLALLAPLLALLLVTLAYRCPRPIALNVGDSYARPLLAGFYDPEEGGGIDYAYTSARAALRLEGIGRGPALLEVRMGGGLPGVVQNLSANGVPLGAVPAGGGLATYAFALPAAAARGGTLELAWEGPTAAPAGDPRSLGLAVDRVTWTPLRGGVAPAWGQLLWAALAALALYALARQLDLSAAWAAALCTLLAAALALGLALARLWLTLYTPRLAGLLIAMAVLLPLARHGTRALFRRLGMEAPPRVESWLWRITALAALVKLGGVLYPHLIVLDIGPHAYRLFRFLSGDWASLFTPNQYSLLGQTVGVEGGQFPYSPLFHVLSAPLTLLPIPLPLAAGLFNGLLEVARCLLLYLLATRLTGRPRAGLWTAFFYTVLPAPYYLMSWGNFPTQLGLFAGIVLVTFLVLAYDRLGRRGGFVWWVAVLVFALLSYTVVGILGVALLALLVLCEWLLGAGPAQRRRALAIVGGIVAAEIVVFLLYHSAFAGVLVRETLPALVQATTEKATGLGPVEVDPRESLASNWVANWIFVQNRITELGVVVSCVGIGALFVAPAGRRGRPLLLAWPGVFILFSLFSGLVADMVLKHILFMFPWLCLGAAVLAVHLWRRGWAGRLAVLAYAAWMLWLSLAQWVELILVKRH